MSPQVPSHSCLIQIRGEPAGPFTAQLVGRSDLSATAPSREKAVEQLRAMLRKQLDDGSLLWVEVPVENPLMRWFKFATDDPDFESYLEELRKYREATAAREKQNSDP